MKPTRRGILGVILFMLVLLAWVSGIEKAYVAGPCKGCQQLGYFLPNWGLPVEISWEVDDDTFVTFMDREYFE